MRRPQIAVLCPRRPGSGVGGAERHLADLGEVLSHIGADVTFVEAAAPTNVIEKLVVRLFPLAKSPLSSWRLRQSAALRAADLVITVELMGVGIRHANHLHLFFGSYTAFRRRALAPPRGIDRLSRPGVDLLAGHLERRTQGSLGAVANSIRLRDELRKHRIPVREEVLLPPTSTTRFRPGSKERARIQLNLPQGATILLFAGRWEYAKGADRVQKIIACMPQDWTFVLACPSMANWPWPSDRRVVRLLDTTNEDMPTLYQAADLLVQPSRFEGYSLVVSEAQACGCPVATSNVGHASHLVGGSTLVAMGVINDADDEGEWMRVIDQMLKANAHNQARRAARHYAEASVSYEAVAEDWAALLRKLLPEFQWRPR